MSTIKSFDDALDFYPAINDSPLARFGRAVRIYWNALGEGLTAARTYHELTRRGVAHDLAVRKTFNEHFA